MTVIRNQCTYGRSNTGTIVISSSTIYQRYFNVNFNINFVVMISNTSTISSGSSLWMGSSLSLARTNLYCDFTFSLNCDITTGVWCLWCTLWDKKIISDRKRSRVIHWSGWQTFTQTTTHKLPSFFSDFDIWIFFYMKNGKIWHTWSILSFTPLLLGWNVQSIYMSTNIHSGQRDVTLHSNNNIGRLCFKLSNNSHSEYCATCQSTSRIFVSQLL